MGLPDFFDLNSVGSDSHLQFLNWTADNNGAWDYAADTRGYTYAAVAEYDDKAWSARATVALMPTVANGIDLDWDLRRARGENFEVEYRKPPLARLLARLGQPNRDGTLRLLGFVNYANMGVYRTANRDALAERAAGEPNATPVITAHPPATTVKYGFGINTDQQITSDIRAFGRFGWNEGAHESFCYSEDEQTFAAGADMAGSRWGRTNDRFGVTGITNAIKRDHQAYLALGGKGFLLGDGRLNYAREDILEAYYTAHNWRGLFTAFDMQLIAHPGYNQDRGPVAVFGVRTHVDF
jgi:carbohydrate-selective porin OprB